MNIALCVICRMENQYISEYVNHYKSLGFDKVFLYDNNYDGEENLNDVIHEDIKNGYVEVIDFRNKQVCQLKAYEDCYAKHGGEYDWIAFFDADEFLIINDGSDIHSFMARFNDYECLLLNWMVMTDSGQIYNTYRPLMERFTVPMAYDKHVGYMFPENNHVKSIVKGGQGIIKFSTPHIPLSVMACCDASGNSVNQSSFVPYNHSVAYLRHFQYKTIDEWINKKMRRGYPDQTYQYFLQNSSVENFFRINEKTQEKVEYLEKHRRQLIIVSMTTIPNRQKRLMDNLPALINQSFPYDKLIINIDDNLTEEDYKWYEDLKQYDPRIEINKSESKWRSCNKLLPTLKKYPHDIIITLDDDVYYPKDTIKYLVEEHYKHPECIIAHEVNPIKINDDGSITYINGYDVKLLQVEWGKYLSNCALFPPYSFDEDLFDYDKMMECTNGTHDELWFWVQSTIHGVQCIGLNYVRSFAPEMLEQYKEGEYCLSVLNNTQEKIDDYMSKINNMYGKRLLEEIKKKNVSFTITKDNIYAFIYLYPIIKSIYFDSVISFGSLTKDWRQKLLRVIKDKETILV